MRSSLVSAAFAVTVQKHTSSKRLARKQSRAAVVVTDGGKGVSWSMGAAFGSLPAYRVPVVDTTGAGDAFLAGLLHRLVKEPNLLAGSDPRRVQQALQFASACGALVCQGAGGIDPQPAEAAVLAFMEQQSAG